MKPSRAQKELIEYFAGVRAAKSVGRTVPGTYVACVREGWIEETEKFPFHIATPAGRDAAGLK